MRLLILGSDGFIGYHLTNSILADSRFDGWKIDGVDLNTARTNMLPKDSRFTFHKTDIIRDKELVDNLILQLLLINLLLHLLILQLGCFLMLPLFLWI